MTSSYQGVFFESAAVRSNEVTGFKSRPLKTSKPVVPLHIQNKKTSQSKPMSWSSLVPVLGVAVLGYAFIPYFALGLAVGVIGMIVKLVILSLMAGLNLLLPETNEDMKRDEEFLCKYPVLKAFLFAVLGPVIEEILFRLILQSLLIRICVFLAPTLALTPFFATGLSVAAAASIAFTAVCFGLAHLGNTINNDSYAQAFLCTISGVVHGVFAVQFGIGATIAAHIANNTTAVSLWILCEGAESKKIVEDDVEVEAEVDVEASPSMAFAP